MSETTSLPRIQLFGFPVVVSRFTHLIAEISRQIHQRKTNQQPFCVMVVSMQDVLSKKRRPHAEAQAVIARFDLCTPDGMPLVWLAKALGFEAERMYGPDILEAVLATTAHDATARHYFVGSTPETLRKLEQQIRLRWPTTQLAGFYSPPFGVLSPEAEKKMLRAIRQAKPSIIWVGLGGWKQLAWVGHYKTSLPAKVVIPVGAAFDFIAGTKLQAPRWMRYAGGEWLFRLCTEPTRLFARYIPDVFWFALLWLIEFMMGCWRLMCRGRENFWLRKNHATKN